MKRLYLMCYVTVVNAEVMPTVLQWHMQTLYLMCYDGICRGYS